MSLVVRKMSLSRNPTNTVVLGCVEIGFIRCYTKSLQAKKKQRILATQLIFISLKILFFPLLCSASITHLCLTPIPTTHNAPSCTCRLLSLHRACHTTSFHSSQVTHELVGPGS
ncbi:hypothetical protein L873DRAFT_113597 [Choiromyces venosus 120613-1]|uniref:Uncharacterized protein n=1 Tax=Choiromyces venosus 120613-1 TaxID=1336337 RepID=A0A3N4J440_9PEZI|nr:hypothetical protein L873DRAFT_113597 [Choiromyces venosus 120613-1]